MIVRIMGEGQWRVDDTAAKRLHELDDEVGKALDAGDEDELRRGLRAMADIVRETGLRLEDDELTGSDAIVPPEDLSIDEARELMHGDGLIPDLPA
jgi:hypothetical protein